MDKKNITELLEKISDDCTKAIENGFGPQLNMLTIKSGVDEVVSLLAETVITVAPGVDVEVSDNAAKEKTPEEVIRSVMEQGKDDKEKGTVEEIASVETKQGESKIEETKDASPEIKQGATEDMPEKKDVSSEDKKNLSDSLADTVDELSKDVVLKPKGTAEKPEAGQETGGDKEKDDKSKEDKDSKRLPVSERSIAQPLKSSSFGSEPPSSGEEDKKED